MQPRHQISRAAIELIKRFEGYRRKAAQLPGGGWTIGYGHTLTARAGAEVSEPDAEALLVYDLIAVAHAVNEATFAPLTQSQFDALCSFVFNIGVENFRDSTVLRRLNAGDHLRAACAMELWRKAELAGDRIVVDALVRRRAAEKILFLTPPAGWPLAPTPILPPILDLDHAGAVPKLTPAVVDTPLDGDRALASVAGEPGAAAVSRAQPSPAQAAAEAVTARLQALFPDADVTPPTEPPFTLTPPEEAISTPTTNVFGRREPPADESPPSLFDHERRPANEIPGATDWPNDAVQPNPHRFPISDAVAAPMRVIRRRPDHSSTWALGAAGLGLFLLGLIGASRRPGSAADAVDVSVLGWLTGLLGVVLCCLVAYRLLGRLGAAARRDRDPL